MLVVKLETSTNCTRVTLNIVQYIPKKTGDLKEKLQSRQDVVGLEP